MKAAVDMDEDYQLDHTAYPACAVHGAAPGLASQPADPAPLPLLLLCCHQDR